MTEKNKGVGGLSRRSILIKAGEAFALLVLGKFVAGCSGGSSSSGGGTASPPPVTQTTNVGAATRAEGPVTPDSTWSSSYGDLLTEVNISGQKLGDAPNGVDLNYGPHQSVEADRAVINVGSTVTWQEVGASSNSASFTAT